MPLRSRRGGCGPHSHKNAGQSGNASSCPNAFTTRTGKHLTTDSAELSSFFTSRE
jgi:hypothetical protein